MVPNYGFYGFYDGKSFGCDAEISLGCDAEPFPRL